MQLFEALAEADCTLAVFSVTEASSLAAASLALEQQAGRDKALILVGNKVDLVRTREVSIAGDEYSSAILTTINNKLVC